MTTDEVHALLARKMQQQRPAMDTAGRFYDGSQPMAWIDPRIAYELRQRVKPLNVNFARLAVDTMASRLRVVGFRSRPGQVLDAELAATWQRNGMDEQAHMAQLDALVFGRAYFMAWPGPDGRARITAESPMQVAVVRDPLTRQVTAALKRWLDPDGLVHGMLLTPSQVIEYASQRMPTLDADDTTPPLVIEETGRVVRVDPNPLGLVPVVPLVHRPTLANPDGESDLTDLMPLVDAIGKLGSDAMVTAEYAAIPRRWATGVNDGAGLTGDAARAIQEHWANLPAARTVITANADARFGTFEQAELGNFVGAIQLLTSQVAAIACLPAWHVLATVGNPTSADAIRASEYRLTTKAEQAQRTFSGPYEDLMRLARFIDTGAMDPDLIDLETLWADPAPATVAQTSDAMAKLVGAGIIDQRAALEALDASPLDIERQLA